MSNTDISGNLDKELTRKAEEEGWVTPLRHNGIVYQWLFREKMTALISILKSILRQEIAYPNEFVEYICPRLVQEEILSLTGWLTHHSAEAWHVSQKREHRWPISPPEQPKTVLGQMPKAADIEFVLDPLQCVSVYHALSGTKINRDDLPLKVFEDQGGWTWRYERIEALSGLFKSIGFLRTEFVWFAHENQAIEIRNSLIKKALEALADELELELSLGKGDSCFEESEPSRNDQYALTTKDANTLAGEPTIDLLALRQASGSGAKIWSEVGSASRHPSINQRYNIRCSDNMSLWSGCFGIGLTRLAVVFLECKGFDPTKWPGRVRTRWQETISMTAAQKKETGTR